DRAPPPARPYPAARGRALSRSQAPGQDERNDDDPQARIRRPARVPVIASGVTRSAVLLAICRFIALVHGSPALPGARNFELHCVDTIWTPGGSADCCGDAVTSGQRSSVSSELGRLLHTRMRPSGGGSSGSVW